MLDPPREGADRAHLAAAARARRRIVYVSCDPQTLGRDARLLRAAGFELAGAVALDLMPQTFHVEVVATFDRAGCDDAVASGVADVSDQERLRMRERPAGPRA